MKKILILGAGYAGLIAAKKAAKVFKKNKDVEIILLDKQPYNVMLTELHEVAANRVDEESIIVDLKSLFAKSKVKFVQDEIIEINYDKKVIKSFENEYNFDYLIIATGSKPTYFNLIGKEFVHNLWSFDDALNLKNHIYNKFKEAAISLDEEKRKKLLSFSIVGGGFTGVEMAGELAEWVEQLCVKYHLERNEVSIKIVDGMKQILPMYKEKTIKKVLKRLDKLKIEVFSGVGVKEVTVDKLILADDSAIYSETVIWCAGIEGSNFVENNIECVARGRIKTNKYLQTENNSHIYVAGDNIFYTLENEQRPVPQMVENAEHSGKLVINNIASEIIGGRYHKKEYKPIFHGSMLCIGGKYGVAEVELLGRSIALSGFFAMFSKHMINIVYFLQVFSLYKIWNYLLHEFYEIKNRRSFVGGLFSAKQAIIFVLLLRVFLGFMWFSEGLNKVVELKTVTTYEGDVAKTKTSLNWIFDFDNPKLVKSMIGINGLKLKSTNSSATEAGTSTDSKSEATGETPAKTDTTKETPKQDTKTDTTKETPKQDTKTDTTKETPKQDTKSEATGETNNETNNSGSVSETTKSVDGVGNVTTQYPDGTKTVKYIDETEIKYNKDGKMIEKTTSPLPLKKFEIPRPKIVKDVMKWSLRNFIMNEDETEVSFLGKSMEAMMTFSEIILGGMLIIGLLTPVAAIGSIIMSVLIWSSGMAYLEILWYTIGSVAVLFGGNVIGIDRYLFPWLRKKVWKNQ